MRFSQQQHREMARRLHERSKKNADPGKAKKQAAMANVFRMLAVRAAGQKINSSQKATPVIDEPTPFADLPVAQQKRPTGMIDPPSPFDTLETWETFLKELRAMPDSDLLPHLINQAKEVIMKKRRQQPSE